MILTIDHHFDDMDVRYLKKFAQELCEMLAGLCVHRTYARFQIINVKHRYCYYVFICVE